MRQEAKETDAPTYTQSLKAFLAEPRRRPEQKLCSFRVSVNFVRVIREIADREHDGNRSNALRGLVADGLLYREAQRRAKPR